MTKSLLSAHQEIRDLQNKRAKARSAAEMASMNPPGGTRVQQCLAGNNRGHVDTLIHLDIGLQWLTRGIGL